jgi:hypothetical protein
VSGKEDEQNMAKTTRKTGTSTTAATPAARRKTAAAPVPEPTHDEIAARAHHIFLRRRATHGHAAHDWFQARAELHQERGLKA